MTPKEKANELFATYRFALSIKNAPLGEQKDLIAKQCALIAVDEIINETSLGWLLIEWWTEVKKEIELL